MADWLIHILCIHVYDRNYQIIYTALLVGDDYTRGEAGFFFQNKYLWQKGSKIIIILVVYVVIYFIFRTVPK